MKNNLKILEIKGIRGMLLMLFVISCAISGFVLVPSWVLMKVYNITFANMLMLNKMELLHGGMLWAIIVLTIYAMNKDKVFVSCKSPQVITPEQIDLFVKTAKVKREQPVTPPAQLNKEEDSKEIKKEEKIS